MFFPDLLPSDEQRQFLEKVCAKFERYVRDCIGYLKMAYDIVVETGTKDKSWHHATVIVLTRHVIEHMDGVSVLVSKGCAQPCQPLLRSVLEAMLGVFYILEADSERRGLAYQLAHAHKKIKVYQRLDPTTEQGKQRRRKIATDRFSGDILNKANHYSPFVYQKMIAELQGMFLLAHFQPIEDEWKRMKGANSWKKDPEWYALFGGPTNVDALATKVGWPTSYEFLYRYWSNEVHAASAMEAFGQMGGERVIRPIRHPEELQQVVNFARQFSLELAKKLVEVYKPAKLADFQSGYIDNILQRGAELLQGNLINAPWRDPDEL